MRARGEHAVGGAYVACAHLKKAVFVVLPSFKTRAPLRALCPWGERAHETDEWECSAEKGHFI